jgi:predicted metal-dependent hydrolase
MVHGSQALNRLLRAAILFENNAVVLLLWRRRVVLSRNYLQRYPPHGRVRVAAPLVVNDEAVRLAVIDKLWWIKRQKAKFAGQPRQSQREMVNGESHYFLGQRYRLRVHEQDGPARVVVRGVASLDLFVRSGTSRDLRKTILLRWHREQLKALIPPLLENWQPILGVQGSDWGIKKMKTKWGAATPLCGVSGSIWNWLRNRCSASNTSSYMSWCIY